MSQERPFRVVLDTNVWSRLAEQGAGIRLKLAAHAARVEICAAPSVLYELALIPEPLKRASVLKSITSNGWRRLMPEAYSESREILESVRKSRHSWLKSTPDSIEYSKLKYDWSRRNSPAKRKLRTPRKAGVWERFRNAPDLANADLVALQTPLLSIAREAAHQSAAEMKAQGAKYPEPLSSLVARFSSPEPGWRGDDFPPWRVDSANSLAQSLFIYRQGGYLDWLEPFIDFQKVEWPSADWLSFWLYDVSLEDVPRQWVRWAFGYLQRFRRVTPGTPGDAQLATYLTEVDVLISCDSALVDLTRECGLHAPMKLASAIRIAGDTRCVDELIAALGNLGASGGN